MPKARIPINVDFNGVKSFMESSSVSENHNTMVEDIPVEQLFPFQDKTPYIRQDKKAIQLFRSIKKYGVKVPIIVRAREQGGQEILAGHHRHFFSKKSGSITVPAIIIRADDNTATEVYIESNKQRADLSPSEKAFVFQLELDSIRRKAGRPPSNLRTKCGDYGDEESAAIIGKEYGIKARQVQNYIRLNYLIPELLHLVDNKKIVLKAGFALSHLSHDAQTLVLEELSDSDYPSPATAEAIKKEFLEGALTRERIKNLLTQAETAPSPEKKVAPLSIFQNYFPDGYSEKQMEAVITELLEKWSNENNTKDTNR